MRLTERDKSLIETLALLVYLTARQIAVPFFDSVKSCRKRCQVLEKEGFLSHFISPCTEGAGRSENVYHLNRKRKADIQAVLEASADGSAVIYRPPAGMKAFPHHHALNDVLVNLVACRERGWGSLHITPEYRTASRKKTVGAEAAELRPDAQVLVENCGEPHLFLLEVCRGTESSQELAWKLQRYLDLWDAGTELEYDARSVESFRVLFVSAGEKELARLAAACKEMETEDLVYLTSHERVSPPEAVLFQPIWTVPWREGLFNLYERSRS